MEKWKNRKVKKFPMDKWKNRKKQKIEKCKNRKWKN